MKVEGESQRRSAGVATAGADSSQISVARGRFPTPHVRIHGIAILDQKGEEEKEKEEEEANWSMAADGRRQKHIDWSDWS